MHDGEEDGTSEAEGEAPRAHLPGFINEDDVGLGDAIRRVTYAVGIKSCGGCERRAALLNRWFPFTNHDKQSKR